MKSFEINDVGDWTLELIDGDDELIQCLRHLIYERVGEWFLNLNHGFRHEVLEEKHYSESEIVQAIYDAMHQEPRVLEVIKVNYDFDRLKRKLSVNFRVRTSAGESDGEIAITI